MECQEARHLLHDLLDDEIAPAERQRLQQHLSACGACRQAEETLGETFTLLKQISTVPAPVGFTDQLLQQLPRANRIPTGRMLSVACLLLLLLASPFYFTYTLHQPQLICQDHSALILQESGAFVVPAGEVVRGNITVYRGNLVVQGQVQGDITLVDGQLTVSEQGSVLGTASKQQSTGLIGVKLALAELWEDISQWFQAR